jgi:uncharacterized membrane protein YfcA
MTAGGTQKLSRATSLADQTGIRDVAAGQYEMDGLNHINPLDTASGFSVGLLVGLTGVGGGALMTPLLVLLVGHA